MNHEPDSRDAEPFPELPTLGARLRWARQRAALTQADLAHQVGKRQQYISTLEQDRIDSPAPAVLAALATVLGVSPAWLMYGVAAPTVDRTGAEAGPPAAPLTAEESRLLQDYRSLAERDRALVRVLLQELRRLPPVSEPQAAPLSEAARRLAQQWEHLSPEGQAAIQAALQAWLPSPPER